MSEELEKAKRAFEAQEPIRPDSDARRAAIGAAMARFEEEYAGASQGNAAGERLKKSGGAFFSRRRKMNIAFPRRYGMLAGGVSLAALSLFALNTGVLQDYMGPYPATQQEVTSTGGQLTMHSAPSGTVRQLSLIHI